MTAPMIHRRSFARACTAIALGGQCAPDILRANWRDDTNAARVLRAVTSLLETSWMRLAQSPLCTRQRPNRGHCGRSELCQQRTCRLIVRYQFGRIPAASSASCQNVCCNRRKTPNSLGVPPTTVANASLNPDRIFGSLRIWFTASLSFSIIGAGVPAGATIPNHVPFSSPPRSIPLSLKVGTFGNSSKRCGPVTARARSFPD